MTPENAIRYRSILAGAIQHTLEESSPFAPGRARVLERIATCMPDGAPTIRVADWAEVWFGNGEHILVLPRLVTPPANPVDGLPRMVGVNDDDLVVQSLGGTSGQVVTYEQVTRDNGFVVGRKVETTKILRVE